MCIFAARESQGLAVARIRVLAVAGVAFLLLAMAGCDVFTSPTARIQEAEKDIAGADYPRARIELKKALQQRPDDAHAHYLLAQVALALGDGDGAADEWDRAVDLGMPRAAAADLGARVYMVTGRYRSLLAQIDDGKLPLQEPARSTYRADALHGLHRDAEALSAYQAALAVDPNFEQAKAGLAAAYIDQGKFDEALALVGAAIARRPDFALGWLLRGTVFARRGQFAQADLALRKALDHAQSQLTTSQMTGLFVTLVETRLANGDVNGAAAVQAQLERLEPNSVISRFVSARVEFARQDYAAAIADLQRLLVAEPTFLPARFLLARALLTQGSLEQSQQELARVVLASPANLEARKLLGQVWLQLGRPEAALRTLLPAMESQSTDAQLRALVDSAGSQLGANGADLAVLEQSVATHPDNDELKVTLAAAYLRNKQENKAAEVLQGTRGRSRLALAGLYLRDGQARKADEVIAQVIAAAPGRADLLYLAGLLYMGASHYEQALKELRAAVDLEPGNAGFWTSTAQAQMALEQPAAARESLKKALGIRSDWLPAVALSAMLDVSSGQPAAAVARVNELRQKHPDDAQIRLLEGDVAVSVRRYAEAAMAYSESYRLHPSSIAALRCYTARRLAGIADPALPLRTWLRRDPEDLHAHMALAESYEATDPAKAIAEYEWIVNREPRSAAALNNLAWLYQTAGNGKALETARKAHELAPAVAAISDTYGWILLQQGRIADALPLLKAAAGSGNAQMAAHYAQAQQRASVADVRRQ